jgi:hypothetical protein
LDIPSIRKSRFGLAEREGEAMVELMQGSLGSSLAKDPSPQQAEGSNLDA